MQPVHQSDTHQPRTSRQEVEWLAAMRVCAMRVAAVFLLLVGAILFPAPLPFGAPLMASGFVLLARTSRRARIAIRRFRSNHPRMPKWLHTTLARAASHS